MYYVSSMKCLCLSIFSWWRHQMETFSALLAICAGTSPITGEFIAQRPVAWSVDVFFHLRLNIRLSKQLRGWWFETPSRPLLRQCNVRTLPVSQMKYFEMSEEISRNTKGFCVLRYKNQNSQGQVDGGVNGGSFWTKNPEMLNWIFHESFVMDCLC